MVDKIKSFYRELLSKNSGLSSMRWSTIIIVVTIVICLLIIHSSLFTPINKGKLNGYEIAAIIGADAALLFSIVYGKYQQHKNENK
jgi:hypothetical protein